MSIQNKIEPSNIDEQWVKTGDNSWVVTLQEDSVTGELILPLPQEMMESSGFAIGDTLDWKDNADGTFSITKVVAEETEWVLVDCVSTFRTRYMVEVPKGKTEYALDTVTMNDAKEFSQEHLGEQIVSYRTVTKEEGLALSDKDNGYTKTWDSQTKIENFFTTWKEQNEKN